MQGFADFADSLLGGAILVALSLALGGVVWGLAVLRAPRGGVDARVVRRAISLVVAGAAGVVVCQAAVLLLKVEMLAAYVGPRAFREFPATLQFRGGCARMLLAAGLAAAALWVRRAPGVPARWHVTGGFALLLAGSGAWLVHAAGRLEQRAPLMALTVVHQVGAAVWVGGLLQLGALWRLARRDAAVDAVWPVLVARFARVAIGSLGILLLAALPLARAYIGSWDGLVGTGYGSLVVTKAGLLAVALVFGAANFLGARRAGAARTRVPSLIEAETILLVTLLFAAASLSAQPPAIDTPGERATGAEVMEVFRPKWPTLATPSVATMRTDTSDPFAVVGGERTPDAYRWSNFSHNVAGIFLLATSLVALAAYGRPGILARHWPLGLVALAIFVFLRTNANDGTWPFGDGAFWRGDAEGLQHRLGAMLALVLGLVEWHARASGRPRALSRWVLPALAAGGGLLLLTHSHTAFELKSSYLVNVTHTTMGALAVVTACTRLLELRLGPPAGRLAGAASTLALLGIALVLVFYREANVVVPPG